MRHRISRLPVFLATISALTACGGGGSDTAPPAPALNKDICFDNSIYAAGASYKLNFKEGTASPVVSGTVLSTNAIYNGVSDLVQFVETTNDTVITVVTRYLKPLNPQAASNKPSADVVALYATEAVQGTLTFTTTIYTPPYEDRRTELSVGETRTFTGQGTRTISFSAFPAQSGPYTRQDQIKFVGVESISSPAGTFTACRYEINGTTTEWLHRSLVVRRAISGGESRILQSGELNGTPLKSQ